MALINIKKPLTFSFASIGDNDFYGKHNHPIDELYVRLNFPFTFISERPPEIAACLLTDNDEAAAHVEKSVNMIIRRMDEVVNFYDRNFNVPHSSVFKKISGTVPINLFSFRSLRHQFNCDKEIITSARQMSSNRWMSAAASIQELSVD